MIQFFRKVFFIFCIGLLLFAGFYYFSQQKFSQEPSTSRLPLSGESTYLPLSIDALRTGSFPGSDFVIEETLSKGSNYSRYIVSYLSEGLKIYGLLTIPSGKKPDAGWPVIVFNHGYIPPSEYKTTERYVAYQDAFARNGYIVFKSDYRGHGNSEGDATGGYGSNAYTIDVLNAVASLKRYPDANPHLIGMWGHSMGGYITLRSMVVSRDIKAGVIWGGVVASYPDLLTQWHRGTFTPPPSISESSRRWRQSLQEQFGTPEQNPSFWNSISANSYLADISGPIQLHHGVSDSSVPVAFSKTLNQQLETLGKSSQLYLYEGDDHNISKHLSLALTRSVSFFDTYLKSTQ
jgi:dipeptidyl aminopeptidase/acylaminoacyl peptidase